MPLGGVDDHRSVRTTANQFLFSDQLQAASIRIGTVVPLMVVGAVTVPLKTPEAKKPMSFKMHLLSGNRPGDCLP